MAERVLIIGANGFLGRKLVARFQSETDVFAMDLDIQEFPFQVPIQSVDITNEDDVLSKIQAISPDVTILTAAMTNVDACEDYPDKAHQINAVGPANVGKAVKAVGGRMIHLSTDFVFDGATGNYSETDDPHPISVYGESKLQGEKNLLKLECPVLICRTSVLYGWPDTGRRDNFFSWVYKQLNAGKALKIIDGQITCPTLVDDLAEVLFALRNFTESSLYHTTGPESLSRYDFVARIIAIFGFSDSLLTKVLSFSQKATRPPNSSLNTMKFQKRIGRVIRPISESFNYLKTTMKYTKTS